MRSLILALALAVSLAATAATGLHGQAVSGEAPAAFCWRGQALPACRSFAIFELEAGLVATSTTTVHEASVVTTEYPAFDHELKWHLGGMRNVSEQWALGATLSVGTGSPTPVTGIRVRARRWLEPPLSAEIEAGAVDTGINDRFGSGYGRGATLGARLNMGDYGSLFTRWEGVYAEAGSDGGGFHRDSGFHHGLYVGASAGSTVAAAGTGVLGLVALWIGYSVSQVEY